MPSTPDIDDTQWRAAELHLKHLGVATPASICRAVTNGNNQLAQQIANELIRRRIARRASHRNALGRWEYLMAPSASLDARTRRDLHAILAFAWHVRVPRRLLTQETLAKLVPIDESSPCMPCFLLRPSASRQPVLSAVHVLRPIRLQTAIRSLDEFVSSYQALIWRPFMLTQSFELAILYRGEEEDARELSRWLRRRPPVSRSGPTPVEVVCRVHCAPSAR